MQSGFDVFSIWPSTNALAEDIGEKPDTVYRWHRKRRIPEGAWRAVIDAAARRGKLLTAGDLLTFNAPMKQRGYPAHEPKSVRRRKRRNGEARASG